METVVDETSMRLDRARSVTSEEFIVLNDSKTLSGYVTACICVIELRESHSKSSPQAVHDVLRQILSSWPNTESPIPCQIGLFYSIEVNVNTLLSSDASLLPSSLLSAL